MAEEMMRKGYVMIVYHGTHNKNAYNIRLNGFLPKPSSRRVWFTESPAYARRRAGTQARRAKARPVVFRCELILGELRQKLGIHRVVKHGTTIIVNGSVSPSVILDDHDHPLSSTITQSHFSPHPTSSTHNPPSFPRCRGAAAFCCGTAAFCREVQICRTIFFPRLLHQQCGLCSFFPFSWPSGFASIKPQLNRSVLFLGG